MKENKIVRVKTVFSRFLKMELLNWNMLSQKVNVSSMSCMFFQEQCWK